MRVLYVTDNSFLRSTASSLNAIIRGLQPRGIKPVMLFREQGPWQQELAAEGVPCYFDSLQPPDKFRPLRSLWQVGRLVRMVRKQGIDLIHCHEHGHYGLLRVVGRWTRVPVVVTFHWNLDEAYSHWAYRRPYVPACLQFTSRAQLERCRPTLPADVTPDRIKVLMSGLVIDDFLARGGSGAELRARWRADDDTVVLGTASALKPRKRLEDFIRLVAALRQRGLKVLGMIAGGGRFADPAYLDGLKELIRAEGIEDACRFTGNLDPVTPFFKAIDFAVNTAEMEILSLSICEGMACGKPTLAYDVGGNAEAVGDPWCIARFEDLAALTEKAAELVRDPALRRRKGVEAERHVRTHFDAPVLAARQAAIYEEVLGRPLAPANGKATPPSALSHSPSEVERSRGEGAATGCCN